MKVPTNVNRIIAVLETAGFEAYAVGGCVRDSLLQRTPNDWDICTSACPEQVKNVFQNERTIDTGLQHGTVTVVLDGVSYEVTTFRIDGEYSDNRRPDSVEFVSDLREDLARRDFTINAMAWNPKTGVVDPFGGREALINKTIACVGDPNARFQEDSLRVLRALRFAAVYGFSIDTGTAEAMRTNCKLLDKVARERVIVELNKTLLGDNLVELLMNNCDVLFEIIPELKAAYGFKQHNPWHDYDVFKHTLVAVDNSERDAMVRLALLLHDIGKPSSYVKGDDEIGHFYGHAKVSVEIADVVLHRLKYDTDTIKTVLELIKYHDATLKVGVGSVKRWMNKLGEDTFRKLIEVRRGDWFAQSKMAHKKLPRLTELLALIDVVIAEGQCFSMKDLAVNGRDLLAMSMTPGRRFGEILNTLLDKVIDGELENDKAVLLEYVKQI